MNFSERLKNYEHCQWVPVLDIVGFHVVELGRHFAVISLIGEVHHGTELTKLRGKWTAVLADTGEPAFITHVRKQPMSLKEIEELQNGKT